MADAVGSLMSPSVDLFISPGKPRAAAAAPQDAGSLLGTARGVSWLQTKVDKAVKLRIKGRGCGE